MDNVVTIYKIRTQLKQFSIKSSNVHKQNTNFRDRDEPISHFIVYID